MPVRIYFRPLIKHLPFHVLPIAGVRHYEKTAKLKEFLEERGVDCAI